MSRKPAASQKLNFEKAMAKLERIVADLESGELSLDESLKAFARGMELARLCQQKLKAAEERIRMVVEKSGQEYRLEPFEQEGEETGD